MMKRHEIQVLRRVGHSQSRWRSLRGRRSGQYVVSKTSRRDERGARRRGIERSSKAEAFRPFIASVLAGEPDLLSLEILRRICLDGYAG